MNKQMWWGYLHQSGKIQVKPWFGDHKDYTEDCEGNEFVLQVVPPFEAASREEAIDIIRKELTMKLRKEDIEKYGTEEEKKLLEDRSKTFWGLSRKTGKKYITTEDDDPNDDEDLSDVDRAYSEGYKNGFDEGYAQAEKEYKVSKTGWNDPRV
jgi:hypothetical protein